MLLYPTKTSYHYIGCVLEEEDDDGDTELRFVRKATKCENEYNYVEPAVEDFHAVSVTSVLLLLPNPISEQCHTKRPMGSSASMWTWNHTTLSRQLCFAA